MYGTFKLLAPDDPAIFAYTRDDRYLVVLNCSGQAVQYDPPKEFAESTIINNTSQQGVSVQAGSIRLEPYDGVLLQSPSAPVKA